MFSVNTILHPTDLSAASKGAFDLACALAKSNDAKLVILRVESPSEISPVMNILQPPEPERYKIELESDLRKSIGPLPPGIHAESQVEIGDPSAVILDYAAKLKCDLIVLGTHGRTGLDRLLVGSVAERILREAYCTVVTVRVPIQDP